MAAQSSFHTSQGKIGCHFLLSLLPAWSLTTHFVPITEIPSTQVFSNGSCFRSLNNFFPCSCLCCPFFSLPSLSLCRASQRLSLQAGMLLLVRVLVTAMQSLCRLLLSCYFTGTKANLCSVHKPKQRSTGGTEKVTAQQEDFSLTAAPLHSPSAVINILFPAGCEALTGFIFNST